MISSFLVGALAGALGFKHHGYIATLSLTLVLLMLVWAPIQADSRSGKFASGPLPANTD